MINKLVYMETLYTRCNDVTVQSGSVQHKYYCDQIGRDDLRLALEECIGQRIT